MAGWNSHVGRRTSWSDAGTRRRQIDGHVNAMLWRQQVSACARACVGHVANNVITSVCQTVWPCSPYYATACLVLSYADDSAQPLSSGIRSGVKGCKTSFKLVHWTVVHDVRHRLSVTTDAQWVVSITPCTGGDWLHSVPERKRFSRLHSRLGRSEPWTRAVGSSMMKEFTGGSASHISLHNSFIEDPTSVYIVDHIGRRDCMLSHKLKFHYFDMPLICWTTSRTNKLCNIFTWNLLWIHCRFSIFVDLYL